MPEERIDERLPDLASDKAKKKRKAVLDENGALIAVEEKDELTRDEIDAGDLPANGKYVYDNGRFYPRGHERGKPTPPQADRDKAIYLTIDALANGKPIPQEAIDWAQWYEHNVLERERGR